MNEGRKKQQKGGGKEGIYVNFYLSMRGASRKRKRSGKRMIKKVEGVEKEDEEEEEYKI